MKTTSLKTLPSIPVFTMTASFEYQVPSTSDRLRVSNLEIDEESPAIKKERRVTVAPKMRLEGKVALNSIQQYYMFNELFINKSKLIIGMILTSKFNETITEQPSDQIRVFDFEVESRNMIAFEGLPLMVFSLPALGSNDDRHAFTMDDTALFVVTAKVENVKEYL